MDEQQKAKAQAQAQARYNAKQEAKKNNVSIFHAQPKRKPLFAYQPPAAAAPTANPQPTSAAPEPAALTPAMSANQPNGQGGQGGWGANLALPGKPLGQTCPNRSTPKSEPTAEQGQAFPDTVTTTPERTPEQDADATRRLEYELQKYKAEVAEYHEIIAGRDKTISTKDDQISALRSSVSELKEESRKWERALQSANDGYEDLKQQESGFNSSLTKQRKDFEQQLAELRNARYKDGQTIQQQDLRTKELVASLSDKAAILKSCQDELLSYRNGDIRDKPNRAQWLKNGQQEFEALVAENANLTAACEQLQQAKLDAEQSLNNVLANQARGANFGPTNTIQQMQKMHHQNGSSSDVSDNALTRQDSQTSQQLDKIQLASSRLMDEMDSSDMESEFGSEGERDGGEEDDNGEKTQTNIPNTAEAQPQPIGQDTAEAQQQLSKSSKPDATSLDDTPDPVDTGRFDKMSEARKTKELLEYDRRLQNAIQKGKQKDGCIDGHKSNIERMDKVIQDRNKEITGLKEDIESQKNVIQTQQKEIKSANSTLEELEKAGKAASQQHEKDRQDIERLRRHNIDDQRTADEAMKAKETAETKLDSMKQDLRKAEEALEKSEAKPKETEAKLKETETKLEETETKLKKTLAEANSMADPTKRDDQSKAEDEGVGY